MTLFIDQLIRKDQCAKWVDALRDASFVSGEATAGWYAKGVKQNEQLPDGDLKSEIDSAVRQALGARPEILLHARPQRVGPLLVSRYGAGAAYGRHVDNAIMQVGGSAFRSDYSATLFLSAPDDYEGGELVIHSEGGEEAVKMMPGDAVIYPCGEVHEVLPVTGGVRMVAVTWMQSTVRDAAARQVLADLELARSALFQKHGRTEETDLLSKTLSNLLRRWTEF